MKFWYHYHAAAPTSMNQPREVVHIRLKAHGSFGVRGYELPQKPEILLNSSSVACLSYPKLQRWEC